MLVCLFRRNFFFDHLKSIQVLIHNQNSGEKIDNQILYSVAGHNSLILLNKSVTSLRPMSLFFGNSKKKRYDSLLNICLEAKLEPLDPSLSGLVSQLKDMELFSRGGSRKVENLFGSKSFYSDQYLFDYSYVVSSGKSSHKFSQTVMFYDCRNLALPDFFLKPENFFDILKEWFGFTDIDFISHPDFSKQYRLTGDFESVIRYYFNHEVLELLSDYKSFWIQASNFYLIIYKDKELIPEEQVPVFIRFCHMIYELFRLRSELSSKELGIEPVI